MSETTPVQVWAALEGGRLFVSGPFGEMHPVSREGLVAKMSELMQDADCPGCQGLRGENGLLSDGYQTALDRLGAFRRLCGALQASWLPDERAVGAMVEEILECAPERARDLPGAGWTDPVPVRRRGAL